MTISFEIRLEIDQTKTNLRSATGAVRTGITGTIVSTDAGGGDE